MSTKRHVKYDVRETPVGTLVTRTEVSRTRTADTRSTTTSTSSKVELDAR